MARQGASKLLRKARKAKSDEFYTQYVDIQKEVEAYLEYNPDTFRGKVVYCNCDDPYESNFFRYFILNFDRSKKAATIRRTEVEPISDDILDEYRWIHSYMYRRGLTDQLIAKFDIGYDEDSDCITFPVRNMQGETVFLQRRGVKAKFHKYEERAPKTEYLYGEYELSLYAADAMTVVVTESIINALSLWKHNIPAVALMGLGGGIQMDLLKNLKCRRIIIAMDPDEPGQEAANKILKALFNSKVAALIEYPSYMKEEELDLNDVIDDIPQIFPQLINSLK